QVIKNKMNAPKVPLRSHAVSAVRKACRVVRGEQLDTADELKKWLQQNLKASAERYDSHLYSETSKSPLAVENIEPQYSDNPKKVDGRVILRDNFKYIFDHYPEALVFGEDTGKLGDVNKGLEDMQNTFGELR